MIRVYVASKFKHAQMWKDLIDEWESGENPIDIKLISRWVLDYAELVPDHPQYCKIGWQHDIEDVLGSDVLMIYVEEGEKLRGALVEAGAALGNDIPVILVGDHPDFGTWQFHSKVFKVEDLDAAKNLLRLFQLELK